MIEAPSKLKPVGSSSREEGPLSSPLFWMFLNAPTDNTTPAPKTITALNTGITTAARLNQRNRSKSFLPCTINKPTAIKITARPRLKARIRLSPKTTLFMVAATRRMAIASGQGTRPPLIASAIRERHRILSSGFSLGRFRGIAPIFEGS